MIECIPFLRRSHPNIAFTDASPPDRIRNGASFARPRISNRPGRVDEGVAPPHPSQTRMCRFPASGSSWESLARGGADDTIRDLPAKNDSREDVRPRFHSCQFSYPLSFRGQVCETQRSLPCFPSTVLSARHPAFLDRSRSVRFPDVTGTIEVLRLPATHIRLLICFASGVRAILLASCFATCAPGRSEGPSGPGSLFNRRPDLPVCSHADVSGISHVSRQSIPCLCPALATPAEPTIPRLLDGFVDAVPALPTAKTSGLNEFRGSVTRLWHPLPTLQE